MNLTGGDYKVSASRRTDNKNFLYCKQNDYSSIVNITITNNIIYYIAISFNKNI